MKNNFFPTRALFWSFWAHIVFIFGMLGYFLMDGLDYMRPDTFSSSLSSFIYVILAAAFIVDSILELLSIYNLNRSVPRYYVMVFSCIFDKIGSHGYFLGAVLTSTTLASSNTVWIFNTVGVCGFAIGAISNMIIRGSSVLHSWANSLNLLGSLLYVLAIFVTTVPLTNFIAIFGDFVYLIDAILYMICWFSDRKLAIEQGEHISLVNK